MDLLNWRQKYRDVQKNIDTAVFLFRNILPICSHIQCPFNTSLLFCEFICKYIIVVVNDRLNIVSNFFQLPMFLSRIEAVNNVTLLHRYYFSLKIIYISSCQVRVCQSSCVPTGCSVGIHSSFLLVLWCSRSYSLKIFKRLT